MTDKEFNAFKNLITKLTSDTSEKPDLPSLFDLIASKLLTSDDSQIEISSMNGGQRVSVRGVISIPCGRFITSVVFRNKSDKIGVYTDTLVVRNLYSRLVNHKINFTKMGLPEDVEIDFIGFMPVEKENKETENN